MVEHTKQLAEWKMKNDLNLHSIDFICDNELIEIKPLRLIQTPLIQLKSKAAIEYSTNNNLTFIITDIEILSISQLIILVNSNDVILTDRTKVKYDKYR